jgi:hypothetical protein
MEIKNLFRLRNRIILLIVLLATVGGFLAWRVLYSSPDEPPESGLTVEIAYKPGYKGVVTVYDGKTPAAAWSSAYEYIIAAAVSPKGENLSVLTLSGSGCTLRIFGLETGSERGSYVSADCLYFELGYLSETEVYAIGGDGAAVFDSGAALVSAYSFPDEYLTGYSAEERKLTLTLSGYRAGDPSRSVTFTGSEWLDSRVG